MHSARLDLICRVELTAILDKEAFTELHLSFRRSMMMTKPILAASRLEGGEYSEGDNQRLSISWLNSKAEVGGLSSVSYLGMLVRYVTTSRKSSSGTSLKAEYSGKVMMGAPSFPRPPGKQRDNKAQCSSCWMTAWPQNWDSKLKSFTVFTALFRHLQLVDHQRSYKTNPLN